MKKNKAKQNKQQPNCTNFRTRGCLNIFSWDHANRIFLKLQTWNLATLVQYKLFSMYDSGKLK